MPLYPEDYGDTPVVITCALSGVVANRNQCPAIPYTPEEYAAEAKRAYEAGATVAHLHARKPDGTPSFEVEDYKNIYDAVTDACPIIINFSTGAIGVPLEQRIHQVTEIKPAIGALNMGSMNYAKYSQKRKDFVFKFVFENTFDDIRFFVEKMNAVEVNPECECFDTGHVTSLYPLMDMGLLKMPFQISCILGVLGGIAPTAKNVIRMAELCPEGVPWEVIGISHNQWMLIAQALCIGGNIRCGLEDNFYTEPGVMAKSNGDLVAKAAKMCTDIGRPIADIEQARKILGTRHT